MPTPWTMGDVLGFVETKSQNTKVPYSERKLVLEKSKLTDKKVS
jgi:hypothetical protein